MQECLLNFWERLDSWTNYVQEICGDQNDEDSETSQNDVELL